MNDSPFAALLPDLEKFIVSADSLFSASSNERRVRVEFSKNRFTISFINEFSNENSVLVYDLFHCIAIHSNEYYLHFHSDFIQANAVDFKTEESIAKISNHIIRLVDYSKKFSAISNKRVNK